MDSIGHCQRASPSQVYEKRKLNRGNKRDPTTGTTIPGDVIIGDILHNNMTLIPFAIDPFSRLGPILRHFLFGTRPTVPLSFPPSRPHATEMYKCITTFPSPTGILQLADNNWTTHRPRRFFGHSYSSPTPSISTLQAIGLCISKSFAAHICYATRRFCDHPPTHITHPTVHITDPT